MAEFRVIEAKPHHVGAILRRMRPAHKSALEDAGIPSHRELSRVFAESSFRRAFMIDGRLEALGGVTGTLASMQGHVWLVVSEGATKYPKAVLREARHQISKIFETHSELSTALLNRDIASLNFAKRLGFQYAPEKSDQPGFATFRLFPAQSEPKRQPPFVIFTMPRCRTYWLSHFLTYRDHVCGHDEIAHIRALDDVKSWLSQEEAGTIETGAAPYWRLLKSLRPDTHVVVIRRNVDEVVSSLLSTGIEFDRQALVSAMRKLDRKLEQIARRFPNALSVNFSDLDREDVCAEIFERCLPYRHDHDWWASLVDVNIEKNLKASYRNYAAHMPQLLRASSICAQEIRYGIWKKKRKIPVDGMTIREERFESAWKDAKPLMAQHCVDVGEPAENFNRKNIGLMRKLDQLGLMQVMTARSNGRMFGYLVTVLGPSLEDATVRVGAQTTFFASTDVPGLGARLQRASIEAFRAHGGNWDIAQRAGVRGDGARLGPLFRRMGAQEDGHLFKISIRGN